MKTLEINSKSAFEKWGGCGEDVYGIAENIISRVDTLEDEDEIGDLIIDALNDELIYCRDQWDVIEFYSMPEDGRTLSDCCEDFISDILEVVEVKEAE